MVVMTRPDDAEPLQRAFHVLYGMRIRKYTTLRRDISLIMHLTRPVPTDLASRLQQLERVVQESLTTVRGGGDDAMLVRIKRLTALVHSSLVRRDPDDVDLVTMQLLPADYAHVVQELRASASGAAEALKTAAKCVAHTERDLSGEVKAADKSVRKNEV